MGKNVSWHLKLACPQSLKNVKNLGSFELNYNLKHKGIQGDKGVSGSLSPREHIHIQISDLLFQYQGTLFQVQLCKLYNLDQYDDSLAQT